MKKQKAADVFKVGKNKIGYVWDSFKNEFGNDDVLPGKVIQFQTLPRAMTDNEIISELKVQECTLGDIIETLKNSTAKMRDGNWNIFYVAGHPSHVVFVCWISEDGGWHVGVWRRAGLWFAGTRVFSPATSGAQILSSSTESPLTLPNFMKDLKELIKKYE